MRQTGLRGITALVLVLASTAAFTLPSQANPPPQPAAASSSAAEPGAPLGRDAVRVARDFVAAHASDYGLGKADVEQLAVSSVVPTEHNGLTQVHLQQQVAGVAVSNAMLNVSVATDGSVFRVASSAVAGAVKRAGAAAPRLSDVEAARSAARAAGLRADGSFASGDRATGADRERELGDGGISSDPVTAQLVYEETDDGPLHLAWEIGINQLDGEHWWQIRVDAGSGKELSRTDWVAEDSHHVFPLPVEAPTFGPRAVVTNPATSASPFGWNDTNGAAGPESTLTQGNNVKAYTDLNADNVPDAGSSPDGGAALNFDFPLDLTQAPSTYRPAAVSNLYYANNRIHDVLHRYGFDEASGNFQVNNYGHGGLGADPVNAEAQDGSGTNNANFATPPDGLSPRMQMFVWDISTPDRDSDLDNGVIIHEYGHGVSNRLTGGPLNTGCLNNQEQGGEGWSDFLAYMLTMPTGVEPPTGRGIGTYVLDEPTTGPGIRTQRYSTDPAVNNHTYDSIKTMAVPHGVGEVWASMLWDLTYALIAEHGFDADLVAGNAGNNKALQLVLDGMKLQPCLPGFVDARDAILAADDAAYGGENECLIWRTFATRGLGFSASQGTSASTADGTEAFDEPPACVGLRVTPTAMPDPVRGGLRLTYDVEVENTSDAPGGLTGVEVTGEPGEHVTYVPGSATCGGTYAAGTDTVTFPIGAMALGTTRMCQFQVRVDSIPFSTPFEDDFEPDDSGWTATHGAGGLDWTLSTDDPHSPTHAMFASEPSSVSDQYLTLTTPVPVAAGHSLAFWHMRGLEAGFDGGLVEVSTDGGATWADIGEAAFTENGYNSTISGCCGSPIGGRRAFSGTSDYVRSVASLAAYVGQSVQVRFRMATDSSVSGGGWRVDDVRIGTIATTTAVITGEATGIVPLAQDVTTSIAEPAEAPGAPTVTGSTPSAGAVNTTFTPPGDDGGAPVAGYTAQCLSTDGGAARARSGAASPIKVTGLSAGKSYRCRVRAVNEIGAGPFSGFGPTVQVPATRPGKPVIKKSKALKGERAKVVVRKVSDGGSAITSYKAKCKSSNRGRTRSATSSKKKVIVKRLTPGKAYTCKVRAKNGVGNGPWSKNGKRFVARR